MSSWQRRTNPIQVGDRVGYSKQFLQSTGQYTGAVPFARGTVLGLRVLSEDCIIAEVQWDDGSPPQKVHAANLSNIKAIQRGE